MFARKLYFSCLLLALIFGYSKTQAQITLTPSDTTLCPGNTYTITGSFAAHFDNITIDDIFSDSIIDIGFPFVFYGQTYTKCVISSNNFISFDTTLAGAFSNYVYSDAKNSVDNEIGNVIMFPFQDIDMGTGTINPNPGVINYQTFGAAPNRTFVVEFCNTPLWSCPNVPLVTDQLILYEGSNLIEMHITQKPAGCTAWGGTGIEGLRYNNYEDLVPGRDVPNVNWAATHDSRRFTPNPGNTSYTIDSIPFNPAIIIPNANADDIVWYEEGSPVPIGNGASVTVTANANVHYYVATITGPNGCNGTSSYTFSDTSWVHFGTTHDTVNATICEGETYPFFGRHLYTSGLYDTLFSSEMGCDSLVALNLTVNPLPDVTINNAPDIELCDGDSVNIVLANPQGTNTYQWLKDGAPLLGATNPDITLRDAGAYQVAATSDKGCSDTSSTINLTVHANPDAEIAPLEDAVICAYDTLSLSALSPGEYDYRWTPEKPFRSGSGPEGQKVSGVFLEPTEVVLTVYNQFGCHDMDSVFVQTKPCCEVFVPSAFSPNGDGRNDYFKPHLQPGQILTGMKVFNRLGQLVYNNDDLQKGWNGKFQNGEDAPSDTYMYYIEYTCADGKLYHKKESITLVR